MKMSRWAEQAVIFILAVYEWKEGKEVIYEKSARQNV